MESCICQDNNKKGMVLLFLLFESLVYLLSSHTFKQKAALKIPTNAEIPVNSLLCHYALTFSILEIIWHIIPTTIRWLLSNNNNFHWSIKCSNASKTVIVTSYFFEYWFFQKQKYKASEYYSELVTSNWAIFFLTVNLLLKGKSCSVFWVFNKVKWCSISFILQAHNKWTCTYLKDTS